VAKKVYTGRKTRRPYIKLTEAHGGVVGNYLPSSKGHGLQLESRYRLHWLKLLEVFAKRILPIRGDIFMHALVCLYGLVLPTAGGFSFGATDSRRIFVWCYRQQADFRLVLPTADGFSFGVTDSRRIFVWCYRQQTDFRLVLPTAGGFSFGATDSRRIFVWCYRQQEDFR